MIPWIRKLYNCPITVPALGWRHIRRVLKVHARRRIRVIQEFGRCDGEYRWYYRKNSKRRRCDQGTDHYPFPPLFGRYPRKYIPNRYIRPTSSRVSTGADHTNVTFNFLFVCASIADPVMGGFGAWSFSNARLFFHNSSCRHERWLTFQTTTSPEPTAATRRIKTVAPRLRVTRSKKFLRTQ